MLVTAGGLDIFNLQRFFATHHHAQKALFYAEPRFANIFRARTMAGLQLQPLTGFIEQQERAHLRIDEMRGLTRDDFKGVVNVDGRVNGATDLNERLKQLRFEPELLVE